MFIFRNLNLNLISQNPNVSNSFSHRNCFRVSFPPNRFSHCFFIRSFMASSKIVAEYAKSNRSTCKKCGETISSKTLRLGLVTKDPRGFEATKWHHLNCFPMNSQSIVSVENIDGFSSLESSDQEVLKNLKDGCELLPKETEYQDEIEGSDEKNSKESKVRKADEVAVDEHEETNSKKPNVSKADEVTANELKGNNSKKPKAATKIVAEYAKSSRSSCKKCAEPISAKTLRLGLVSRDPRGFDATKWHHLNCFPLDSQLIVSVDNIDGFSSLENNDQEVLKNLIDGCARLPNEDEIEGGDEKSSKEAEVSKADEVAVDKPEENDSKKPKVRKADEVAVNELEGNTSKKQKASTKIVAEYAKSSRSTCKKCAEPISAKTLRVGLVSRDPRGFDATKWHHLNCFPIDSQPIVSVEMIDGFSSLESNDQEALKNLMAGCEFLPKEDGIEGSDEESLKESKVPKANEVSENELKGTNTEKPNESKLELVFSVSDVKDKYKDASLLPKWKAFQSIIFLERDEGLHDSAKIAAFDFDGCLVNTSVRRIGADAWSLLYPSIPEKLKSLYDDGYKLVIFTNEANIERWKNKRQVAVDSKIGRLNNFIDLVKVPMQVFIACGIGKTDGSTEDPFRKPKPGMWRIMEQQFNSGIKIDMDRSFYVGDAAGRANDHSDADIGFAKAIGLKFFVPEDYFNA